MNNFDSPRNSIYCYPNSDVLVNNLNIHDNKKLSRLERQLVLAKSYILRQNTKIQKFDKNHFLNIHKFLFEDIYPFAGKLRVENISKDNFIFANWEFIDEQLDKLLEQLKSESYLAGLPKVDLAKRLSYYLAELNVLHPFREGNGRTIREFIRELAFKNHYILNLKNSSPKEIFEACVKSVYDYSDLEIIMLKCLQEIPN